MRSGTVAVPKDWSGTSLDRPTRVASRVAPPVADAGVERGVADIERQYAADWEAWVVRTYSYFLAKEGHRGECYLRANIPAPIGPAGLRYSIAAVAGSRYALGALTTTTDWYGRLSELANLKRDWDGRGAPAPSSTAVSLGISVLIAIQDTPAVSFLLGSHHSGR